MGRRFFHAPLRGESCSYRVTISGLIPKGTFYQIQEFFQVEIFQSLRVLKQGAYPQDFREAIPSLTLGEGLSQRISEVFSKSMITWPFFN